MTPYDEIVAALKKAQMGKADLNKITGIPWGPLGHALEVLTLEGKVVKEGLRYRLPKENGYALPFYRTHNLVHGRSPRER